MKAAKYCFNALPFAKAVYEYLYGFSENGRKFYVRRKSPKKVSKNFRKTIEFSPRLCYNIGEVRGKLAPEINEVLVPKAAPAPAAEGNLRRHKKEESRKMKRLILLAVGMLTCLALFGGALAAVYQNAGPQQGSVLADSYLYLSIGGSTATSLTLDGETPSYHMVVLEYDSSKSVTDTATFTVELKNTDETATTNYAQWIKIELCSDSKGTALTGDGVTTTEQTGKGTLTVTGITKTTTVYVKISLTGTASNSEYVAAYDNISAQLVLNFKKA